MAAVYRGQIVGLVVAEIKDGHALPKEDSEILASTFDKSSKIGYILSLGKWLRIYFRISRVQQEAKVNFNTDF